MSESRLQEIVTKAVVGRCERRLAWSHTVPAEGVTGVLGVYVTSSTVAVKEDEKRPVVDVLVDCDLWCANQKNTKVLRCTCRNTDAVEIKTVGSVVGEAELSTKLLGSARATGVKVSEGQIVIAMEADVVVEKSALSRLVVKAYELDDDEVLGDLDDPEDDESGSSSGE